MPPIREDRHGALVAPLDLGPADGPRVAVKDCLDIAGHQTRAGSAALETTLPAQDHAEVVAALLAAGCRIIGKARMHELAYGMTGINRHGGTPVNPAWPERIPGGSSSGSAVAVASGLADFAIGTDTGGSIRQPAICCGIAGFKPTYGRISRKGATPAESSLDCIGPMARDPRMLICAMTLIDPGFAPAPLPAAPRLLALKAEPDPAIHAALDQVGYHQWPQAELPSLAEAFHAGMVVIGHETARAFGHLLDGDAPLGADIRHRLGAARRTGAEALVEAEHMRQRFTAEVDALLAQCDALLTPAMPQLPPTLAEAQDPQAVLNLTLYIRPFNLSGHPAVVLPLMTAEGLPAGVQLVGRKGEDAGLLALAQALWQRHDLRSAATKIPAAA